MRVKMILTTPLSALHFIVSTRRPILILSVGLYERQRRLTGHAAEIEARNQNHGYNYHRRDVCYVIVSIGATSSSIRILQRSTYAGTRYCLCTGPSESFRSSVSVSYSVGATCS
jgi:hypothetical protein